MHHVSSLTNELASSSKSEPGRPISKLYKKHGKADISHTFYDAGFSVEQYRPSVKRFKMNNPDTQNNTFLFTSESVGEGHPGKLQNFALTTIRISISLRVVLDELYMCRSQFKVYL